MLLILVLPTFSNQHLAFKCKVLVPRGRLTPLIELCRAAQHLGRLVLVLDSLVSGGSGIFPLHIHGFGLSISTAIAYGSRSAVKSAV